MKDFLQNPTKLFMLVVGVYLGIQVLNIVLNATGLDLGPPTQVLDMVINNGTTLVAVLGIIVVIVYFYNRIRQNNA